MPILSSLQNVYSVQFDDLFKKAWEEDIIEGSIGDGEILTFLVSWYKLLLFYLLVASNRRKEQEFG